MIGQNPLHRFPSSKSTTSAKDCNVNDKSVTSWQVLSFPVYGEVTGKRV